MEQRSRARFVGGVVAFKVFLSPFLQKLVSCLQILYYLPRAAVHAKTAALLVHDCMHAWLYAWATFLTYATYLRQLTYVTPELMMFWNPSSLTDRMVPTPP